MGLLRPEDIAKADPSLVNEGTEDVQGLLTVAVKTSWFCMFTSITVLQKCLFLVI